MGSSVPLENKAAPQEKSPAEARPRQTGKSACGHEVAEQG
jgi:hypothetical protein